MDNLKDKAIQIQGKDYVLVSDRVIYFNEKYPDGSIMTELLSKPEDKTIVIKATVLPDIKQTRQVIGHAQEIVGDGFINKSSALENAETSAVGRALAFMGIGVIESIASADEMNKAIARTPQKVFTPPKAPAQIAKGESCNKCGSAMKISQTGSKYCASLCWKNPKPIEPQIIPGDNQNPEQTNSLQTLIDEIPF